MTLAVAAAAVIATLAGLSSWLATRDAETRRAAALSVSDPNSPRADFNGDGFSDLAVGVPYEDLLVFLAGQTDDAGAVQVVYGSADGVASAGTAMVRPSSFWHQDRTGALDTPEATERFGLAVTAGDFNGDTRSDLAVAVPAEDDGAGAVHVFYGSVEGLSSGRAYEHDQILRAADLGVTGPLFPTFDMDLAWGNFDADDYGDLVIASSDATVNGREDAGAVHVVYGSATGLDLARRETWTQNALGSVASAAAGDHFGSAVAAGDFDGDEVDDLAVGASGEQAPTGFPRSGAGEVEVLYGVSGQGLTATGVQRWREGAGGLAGTPDLNDNFGGTLAAGDFNGDARDDLAVGVPRDERPGSNGSSFESGAVNVIYGSAAGLTSGGGGAPNNQQWHQDTVDEGSEIEDQAESGDLFGKSLAAGDFDGDGDDDLAVGALNESVGTIDDAGAVNVIYGSSAEGLDASGDELFHQDRGGIDDEAETRDQFGAALAAGDFGGGDEDDLAVGARYEDVGSADSAGLVHMIYGDAGSGLTSTGSQLWTQDSDDVPDGVETGDRFGWAIAP